MTTQTPETRLATFRAEDLARLADAAERAGVRILVDRRAGRHVATDADDPTACHLLDDDGCTCRRFALWGRCGHHALLLAELGRLPDAEALAGQLAAPTPLPATAAGAWSLRVA